MSPIDQLLELHAMSRPAAFAVLPALVLVVFAIVTLLADLLELGSSRGPAEGQAGPTIMAPWLAMTGTAIAFGAVVWQWLRLEEEAGLYFNGMIALDGFAVFLTGVVVAATLLTLLLTVGYSRRHNVDLAEYYHLILMAAVGMVLLVEAANLVMVFLGLEVMSVSVYILTGFRRTQLRSIEGALKYFVLGAFSTGFFVYGIAMVYGTTGTMDLAEIGTRIATGPPAPLLLAGVGLLVIGFGFKVALVPFHMWSPDVYEGAPTPITGFMATGVKAAGFAAFVRVFLSTFDALADQWVPVLWVLAVLTMLVGNVAAIRQDDVKRMLAYSSIAHAGYLVVAMVAHNALGTAAVLYYLAAYTAMTVGAFGVAVTLSGRGAERTSISRDYAGLGYSEPLLAAAMAVFMFSLTGVPPTAGFVGKFYIISAAVDAGHVPLAVLLVVASVISAYYYLKVVVAMYMTSPSSAGSDAGPTHAHLGALASTAILATVVAVLGMGIFPGEWIDMARASVEGLATAAARLP
ncbi:MAG: NADH-quinone oxidoreductase subunit N [Gemmatimonadetes bacterium]|nr:NADH-quinone oxidoreductase subunit N [Gemmatimonadota bacterium]